MNKSLKISRITIQITVILLLVAGLLYRTPMLIQAATPPAPVLLVTNAASSTKYGPFIGEILRAEGLNNFDRIDLSQMTFGNLSQYGLVVLAQTALVGAHASNLRAYVNGGGRLLAMRPDAQIADIFGLGASAGQQTDGYLAIANAAVFDGQTPGAGLLPDSLQIHGTSDKRPLLNGAVMLAQLYTNATSASGYPAVSANIYGLGRAVAFNFDLPANIVMIRQGNPLNANVDVDADGVLRTIDMFQKVGGGAPWVDLNKVPIPQADEQQRFFARLVKQMQLKPAPQLWYFPGNVKTMLILTGDAHGNPTSYYQTEINSLNKYGAKMTFYMSLAGQPNDASVQAWRAQGHEFGIHPYAYKPDTYPPYNVTSLSQGYNVIQSWFSTSYSSAKSMTARNHQVAWLGYTDVMDLEVAYGISMDTNFYSWGPWLQKTDGTWAHGYTTGSGLPMKMVKLDGSITPVYQVATQLVDEQMIIGAGSSYENLTAAQGFAVSKAMIDASQAGNYSALMSQNHVDYYVNGDPLVWWENTMAYAQTLGIPMWNADQWLRFTTTRHDANYSATAWNAATGSLTFDLNATAASGVQLTTMLPMTYAGKTLIGVLVNGTPTSFQQTAVKGVNTALLSLPSGNYSFQANYQQGAQPTATVTPIPGVPTATATSTPLPGLPTATPLPATATPFVLATPTPTALPSGGSLVHSTFADFGQTCVLLNQTHLSDSGGGAVALAAAFSDDFTGVALNGALWSAGNWGGGSYSPTLANGALSVHAPGGGWVRSIATYTHGTMEAVAEFGNGAYQHIGFGSDGFSGNRYLIFSTAGGDGHLHARVNNNVSEQNIDLGVLPVGAHRYRIEWTALNSTTDQVIFTLDGVQQASLSLTNAGASGYYLYLTNALDLPALNVDAAQVVPAYLSSGTYTSCPLDAGTGNTWNQVAWDAITPLNTAALFETHLSADGLTWGAWTTAGVNTGTPLTAPQQFIQYRLTLNTTDNTISPLVNAVTVSYVASTVPTNTPLPSTATSTPLPPTATSTPLPPTATPAALFPQALVLDTFNRANGALGANWRGAARFYQISANQLKVTGSGDMYWSTSFGTTQQVYVTLSTLNTGSHEIDLLLKSQSATSYNKGVIEVLYDPNLKRVEVWTYAPSGGWVQYGADIPVTFVNGDQFGASATANGTVSVYRNGALIAARSIVTWPFYNLSGYIGLWMVNAPNMLMDNFGGGNY